MTVNVLVCRFFAAPVIETLTSDANGSYLEAMTRIVDGYVQCITLDDGVDLWCNEDGIGQGLPLNRCIPTVGRAHPDGFGFVIDTTGGQAANAGEAAEWRIHGDFFLARSTPEGELASVTDDDVARYRQLFANVMDGGTGWPPDDRTPAQVEADRAKGSR
jgi:hypothetical protein